MARCVFLQSMPAKLPERETAYTLPRDAPLKIGSLEGTDKDHAEVDARRNARTTTFFAKRLALRPAKVVKLSVPEHTIQTVIKHMPVRRWLHPCRHPQFLLPLRTTLTRSHPLLSIHQYQDREQGSANSSSVLVSRRLFQRAANSNFSALGSICGRTIGEAKRKSKMSVTTAGQNSSNEVTSSNVVVLSAKESN